jgi:hypothetical protein
MQADVIRRLHIALPHIREWIDRYLAAHSNDAKQVSTLGFKRLAICFPASLLERAKVVSVDRTPFPPVEKFGLPELASPQHMPAAGITFKDTFFIQRGGESLEGLHFHELVHVVQWARLGVDDFLLAYGLGLYQCGYEQSPLEEMAFSLQRRFEADRLPNDLVSIVEAATDGVWNHAREVL